jgi:hypothetical protein
VDETKTLIEKARDALEEGATQEQVAKAAKTLASAVERVEEAANNAKQAADTRVILSLSVAPFQSVPLGREGRLD